MPQTNTQFHGANHIYKISCESQDKALLQENKVKIKEITPLVTLPAKRSYFIMEKVADRLLVIAYDTKGNTYAMLYDEKGNLQKELKPNKKFYSMSLHGKTTVISIILRMENYIV